MKRLFGAAKEKAPPPSLEDANSSLGSRGDTVDDKARTVRKLDAQLAQYREQIKRTRPGPAQEAVKRRAMQVLKQKRLYEGQREQLYNQQFGLEQVAFAQQTMKDSQQQLTAMKAAAKDLKGYQKTMNINKIEAMQDEMYDLVDYANEMNDVMGRSYGVPEDIDEDELLGELDALETDMISDSAAAEDVPSYLQPEPQVDDFGLPVVPNRPMR
eukprot:jgi/Chlat1/9085/Chrsp96S08366